MAESAAEDVLQDGIAAAKEEEGGNGEKRADSPKGLKKLAYSYVIGN